MSSRQNGQQDDQRRNETPLVSESCLCIRSIPAFGTTASVAVTDSRVLDHAEALLACEIDAMDDAASRFRPDTEVSRLRYADGGAIRVSPLMFEAVAVAVAVAEWTGGAVDPTVGRCVEALGYDRDFPEIHAPFGSKRPTCTAPGWRSIQLDHKGRTVRVPRGTLLDLALRPKPCPPTVQRRPSHVSPARELS